MVKTKLGEFSGTEMTFLVLAALVLVVLATVWIGFVFMILVGILSAQFGWLAPIGFMSAWGITFFGGVILGYFSRVVKGAKNLS